MTTIDDLPTFDDMRATAFRLLGDARDELKSDSRPGAGPNRQQTQARRRALEHIGLAKTALDDAARAADRS